MSYWQGLEDCWKKSEQRLFAAYRRFFKKNRIKKEKLAENQNWKECSPEQLLAHAHALLEDHDRDHRSYCFGTIDAILKMAGHSLSECK